MHTEEYEKACAQALKFLGPRFLSRLELTQKLKRKEYSSEVIEEVLTQLEEWNYINDERLAAEVGRLFIEEGKYGCEYIRQKMYQRGLPIPEVVREYDELPAAFRLVERYFPEGEVEGAKLFRFLTNRGYRASTVREVANTLGLWE